MKTPPMSMPLGTSLNPLFDSSVDLQGNNHITTDHADVDGFINGRELILY